MKNPYSHILETVIHGKQLSAEEIENLLQGIIDETISREQAGAILACLSMKGETPQEIAAFSTAMRRRLVPVEGYTDAVDLCGTGGDGLGSFNISTTAMCIVAGAQQKVAKHGNRAASGLSGSADVLEALGLSLAPTTPNPEESMIFMFAPNHHPAMKHIAEIRKGLGVPTVFNILGPLLNPANVSCQVIGTTSKEKAERIAGALQWMNFQVAGVVYNDDGLDELTTTSVNHVIEIRGTTLSRYDIDAKELGLKRALISDLTGGDAYDNARILRLILEGEKGPKRDISILNAGFVLYIADRAKDLEGGIALAVSSLDSGNANKALKSLIAASNQGIAHDE